MKQYTWLYFGKLCEKSLNVGPNYQTERDHFNICWHIIGPQSAKLDKRTSRLGLHLLCVEFLLRQIILLSYITKTRTDYSKGEYG